MGCRVWQDVASLFRNGNGLSIDGPGGEHETDELSQGHCLENDLFKTGNVEKALIN